MDCIIKACKHFLFSYTKEIDVNEFIFILMDTEGFKLVFVLMIYILIIVCGTKKYVLEILQQINK
jgi:hypothetical protein